MVGKTLNPFPRGRSEDPLAAFSTQEGQAMLLETLKANEVVNFDTDFANDLISQGTLVPFPKGQDLIQEGTREDHVFFLVSGEVEVWVGNSKRPDVQRQAPDSVGEMAADQPQNPRTATIKASDSGVVALRVSGQLLRDYRDRDPAIRQRLDMVIKSRGAQAIKQTGQIGAPFRWFWLLVSIIISLIGGGIVGAVAYDHGWAPLYWILAGLGTSAFLFVLIALLNPDYVFHRAAGTCVFGILTSQWLVTGFTVTAFGFEFGVSISEAQSDGVLLGAVTPTLLAALSAYLFRLIWKQQRLKG